MTWGSAVYISKAAMKKINYSSQYYLRLTWIDIERIPHYCIYGFFL